MMRIANALSRTLTIVDGGRHVVAIEASMEDPGKLIH
jgi:hypothetical protein